MYVCLPITCMYVFLSIIACLLSLVCLYVNSLLLVCLSVCKLFVVCMSAIAYQFCVIILGVGKPHSALSAVKSATSDDANGNVYVMDIISLNSTFQVLFEWSKSVRHMHIHMKKMLLAEKERLKREKRFLYEEK